ncbi:gamma-glutamylcyclotransferase family protein [Vreelandella salicampi]|uniref:Gamma-glutamylcyclotransferase n=1 Tax=Vreelandella salicampi TaxID=1449798 RepID=A0A7Z0LI45_9GAMM|nr:gamma-glutamylcyclotransferase family protein [Halomonas salicampi]NYS59329.1 gamma-glutamylcyclotransferase [Halomonas salicampi]
MEHLQRDIKRCRRVAVYGTLKRGYRNHDWLEGATLLGQDRLSTITLYDLGHCPGAKREASNGAAIEVYAINPEQLALLDQLEDYIAHAPHTGVYDRAIFPTQYGDAWCYLYNADVEGDACIESGEW